jgi:hypothetical protein
MVLKEEIQRLIEPHIVDYRGKKAIALENGRLDFKQTYLFYGITPQGNVILGEIIQEGPNGMKIKRKIAKIRVIGDKKTLTIGSGRGTDNYYLDLE